MEIKTKFNIGDTAYRIVDNYRLVKEIINNIQIDVYTKSDASIFYTTESRITICERLLYKNVEEIIDNFKKQVINITINK